MGLRLTRRRGEGRLLPGLGASVDEKGRPKKGFALRVKWDTDASVGKKGVSPGGRRVILRGEKEKKKKKKKNGDQEERNQLRQGRLGDTKESGRSEGKPM